MSTHPIGSPEWLAAARAKGRPEVGVAKKKKRGKRAVRVGVRRADPPNGAYCEVVPLGFLGSELFDLYRSTVSQAGFRWDKDARTNLGFPRYVATLARRLKRRGFEIVVTPEVHQLVEKQRAAAVKAVDDCEARLAWIDEYMEPTGKQLFGYQRTAALFLSLRAATQRGALLADDMGLGKTVEVLAALPEGGSALVLSPAKAKPVWRRHVDEWRGEDLSVEAMYGMATGFRWPTAGELVVTNPAILPAPDVMVNELAYGAPVEGTWLVVDEGEWVKNTDTQQGQKYQQLAKMVWNVGGFVVIVTATAVRNVTGELFRVLESADCAVEAFGTWWGFVDSMGGTKDVDEETGRSVYEWHEEDQTEHGIEQLREVCLRRKKELGVGSFVRSVWVELEDKEVEDLATEVLASFAGRGITLDDIAKDKAPEEIYEEARFKTLMKALNMAKIPAMLDHVERLLEDDPENRVLIGSLNRGPIEATAAIPLCEQIMGGISTKRVQESIDAFQGGMLKAIGATIGAGGVAITLTAANHVVFCGEDYTDAANRQFIGRALRTGQERDVWIWRVVADHPIEAALAARLDRKRREFEASLGKAEVDHEWVDPVADELRELLEAVPVEEWEKPKPKPRRGPADNVEEWAINQLIALHGPQDGRENPWSELRPDDREFAGGMANTYRRKGTLTVKQWPFVLKTVKKYRKEVGPPPELVLEPGALDPEADAAIDWSKLAPPEDDIPF